VSCVERFTGGTGRGDRWFGWKSGTVVSLGSVEIKESILDDDVTEEVVVTGSVVHTMGLHNVQLRRLNSHDISCDSTLEYPFVSLQTAEKCLGF
jgi:hypothetical protein